MDWKKVSEANKNFYDQIASIYDQVDSRRREIKHEWIDQVLIHCREILTKKFPQESFSFLDAGTGSGLLALQAKNYFNNLILVDISQAMLDQIKLENSKKIVADCASIPLEENSVHMIGAFATLHHLFRPKTFFLEAKRILKVGGILYTDHDIEENFVNNFNFPLKVYRKLFDHGINYLERCPEAKKVDYELSEFHGEKGLSGKKLAADLESLGFKVLELTFHWQGMGIPGKIINSLTLNNLFNREGMSPIIRIIAQKVK